MKPLGLVMTNECTSVLANDEAAAGLFDDDSAARFAALATLGAQLLDIAWRCRRLCGLR
jgi:hypothetical protein